MSAGLHLHRQGTRDAYAACAAAIEAWQALSVHCAGCNARYIGSVPRRGLGHDAATVRAYADIAGQLLLAERALARECPDHGSRLRSPAFSVVA